MAITIDGAGTITGITEGGLNDGIITENELVAAVTPIGVGQTWQDVTASRASGVTLTNSTGRPIKVNIRLNPVGSGTRSITVDGLEVSRFDVGTGSVTFYLETIVPAGSTYLVNAGVSNWFELR